MMPRTSYISIRDQFCGAGGNTIGARLIPGVQVVEGINHWKRATETYATNNPEARVVLTDLHTANPSRYGATDILITSPECPNHSLAKGARRKNINQLDFTGKSANTPEAERSRMTMWCVINWAEQHRYNIVITENVVDIFHWDLFSTWLTAMHKLGYNHECVFFNSMFAYPTPQSRDRIYIVFWRKGNKKPNLKFTPLAYCPTCAKDVKAVQAWKDPHKKKWGRYGPHGQYLYRCPSCTTVVQPYFYCAANAIRWDVKGERIGDKQRGKRPLSDTTLQRIRYGLVKYGYAPFLQQAYTPRGKPWQHTMDRAMGSITTIDHHQFIEPPTPFVFNVTHAGATNDRTRGVREPGLTQTADLHHVQVECRDFRRVLDTYDTRATLWYVDPPYALSARDGGKRYAHEMTEADHRDLVARLRDLQGMVALSGYRVAGIHAPLERDGWARQDFDVPVSAARLQASMRRTESVWRNPAAVAAWRTARMQQPLFTDCEVTS